MEWNLSRMGRYLTSRRPLFLGFCPGWRYLGGLAAHRDAWPHAAQPYPNAQLLEASRAATAGSLRLKRALVAAMTVSGRVI
jgi:hypothetical protein